MAKHIEREYRVIVEPDFWLVNEDQKMCRCKDVLSEIARHVDDISNAYVDVVETDICSHCKSEWDCYDDGLPGCCDKAQEEFADAMLAAREEKSDD